MDHEGVASLVRGFGMWSMMTHHETVGCTVAISFQFEWRDENSSDLEVDNSHFWSLRDDNRPHQSVSYGNPKNKNQCCMLGLCRAHVGPMLALCWAHVQP